MSLAGLVVLAGPHGLREIFEIDLVADAGAGRHDAEIVEGLLAPAQELVALAIALIFELDVLLEAERRAEAVDHHRVVDDEIDRHQRIDLLRIGAERGGRIAHRREIDHGGDAGEILHQHARRAVARSRARTSRSLSHCGDRHDVLLGDGDAVLEAQQILEHHLHRMRQLRHPRQAVLLGQRQREIGVGLVPDRQSGLGLEAVERLGHGSACSKV